MVRNEAGLRTEAVLIRHNERETNGWDESFKLPVVSFPVRDFPIGGSCMWKDRIGEEGAGEEIRRAVGNPWPMK